MKKLKVLELFAGTRSIGKAFEERGHEVYSIDFDPQHENIDWYIDIEQLSVSDILKKFGIPDVIWASPDCTTYSIAGVRHHRKGQEPISDYAIKSDRVVKNVLEIISYFSDLYGAKYFIENPRGMMRKMDYMKDLPRYTVTYCQYGDFRMKPTDIWTNITDPQFREMCKNGQACHVSAPRGSSTGTQGIKCVVDRSRIPKELCNDIVLMSEGLKVKPKQYKHMDEKEVLK